MPELFYKNYTQNSLSNLKLQVKLKWHCTVDKQNACNNNAKL